MRGISIYGIVRACYSPKKTAGPDHLCILQITDETTTGTDNPYIDVRVFGKPKDLKMIRDLGDIVRIDNLYRRGSGRDREGTYKPLVDYRCSLEVDQKRRRELQGSISFYDHTTDDFEPYVVAYSSTPSDEADEVWAETALDPAEERERLDLLKDLSRSIRKNFSKPGGYEDEKKRLEYEKNIRYIKAGEPFDLVCKILHVREIELEDEIIEILYVWDSTDVMPQNKADTATADDPTLRDFIEKATKFDRLEIPSECVENAPDLGSIMPIFRMKKHPNRVVDLAAGHTTVVTPFPGAGSYIRLRNLMPIVNENQLQCFISGYTVWTLHIEDTTFKENLKMRRKINDKAFWKFDQHVHAVSASSVTCKDDVPISSLRDIRKCAEKQKKFRCLVRCYDTYPQISEPSMVQSFRRNQTDFLFFLRVEDATDAIDLIVCGEEAKLFLSRIYGPDNVVNDIEQDKKFYEKIQLLLRDPDPATVSSPPFVNQLDCCIAKYTKSNNKNGSERVNEIEDDDIFYKLCETVLN